MKAIDDISNGGGGSNDLIADIRAALVAELATSSSITSAEETVSVIRDELGLANRELSRLIREHHENARSVGEGSIRNQQKTIEKIEARLGVAVATMTSARESFAPNFGEVIEPFQREAGWAILDAVTGVERAVLILVELEKFAVKHGLPIARLAHALPRPADLRRLGERLGGSGQ